MSDDPQKPELDNEHRYMALLALTSQELPAKSDIKDTDRTNVNKLANKQESMFDHLDADPAALESFLRRERQSGRHDAITTGARSVRAVVIERVAALWSGTSIRYATAFGMAAVISILVVTQLPNNEPLTDSVEQSYAGVTFTPTQSSLILPWERPPAALGFAPTEVNISAAAIEFAKGLMRGKQLLLNGVASVAVETNYGALGEWNVLLWTASESTQPAAVEFWRSQQKLGAKLTAATYDRESGEMVAAHLARVGGLIDALAAGQNTARNARALADELLLFREQFSPHDKSVFNSRIVGGP